MRPLYLYYVGQRKAAVVAVVAGLPVYHKHSKVIYFLNVKFFFKAKGDSGVFLYDAFGNNKAY